VIIITVFLPLHSCMADEAEIQASSNAVRKK
jgi:hypothetical protein